VRGQRTRTNARTRKGPRKTVGAVRGKEARAAAKTAPSERINSFHWNRITWLTMKGEEDKKAKQGSRTKPAAQAAGTPAADAAAVLAELTPPRPRRRSRSRAASTFRSASCMCVDLQQHDGVHHGHEGRRARLEHVRSQRVQGIPQEHGLCRHDGGAGCGPPGALPRLQEVEVRVQGPGAGRESAIRAIQAAGFTFTASKM
jgi:hypothetical protein